MSTNLSIYTRQNRTHLFFSNTIINYKVIKWCVISRGRYWGWLVSVYKKFKGMSSWLMSWNRASLLLSSANISYAFVRNILKAVFVEVAFSNTTLKMFWKSVGETSAKDSKNRLGSDPEVKNGLRPWQPQLLSSYITHFGFSWSASLYLFCDPRETVTRIAKLPNWLDCIFCL